MEYKPSTFKKKKKLIDMQVADRFEINGKKYTITQWDHKAVEALCDENLRYEIWPIRTKVTPIK